MKFSFAKIFHNFVTLLSTTVLAVQPVLAQNITAAPTGPQVLTSASGIDLVMINGVDANGVSHNIYTDFNVGPGGVIFNNGNTEFVMTDLAGWVQGNGNLIGGTAQIIINEVIGGSTSSLNGFMEVAGDRADVIVANAYGITCNGCGFINTDRAVLTTGTTSFTNGSFTGFSVEQGGITIGEHGANALGTTQFDLISRQLTVAGAIAGHRLRVVTGRNDVTYITGEVVEKAPNGSAAPALAIDSTVLGGMYGDSITILSTEDGVGVRTPDNMAANAGEMVITADGRLVMRRVSAVGNVIATSSDDIVVEESVIATGNLALMAARDIALAADTTLVAQSALTLDAGRNADFGAGAKVLASTALTVNAGQDISLADGVSLASYNTLDLLGQNLTATGQSTLVSGAQDANGQTAIADLNLTFQNRIDLSGAIVASSGALSVESQILDIAAAGAIPAAQFVATLDMAIAAADISANGAMAYAGGKLNIGKTPQDLALQGGTFSAEGAVAIAGQAVALDATILSRTATLDVAANSLTQAGYLGAATTLDIASAVNATLNGTVLAGGAATINAGGALGVSGLVQASTALDISAGSVNNSGTILASAGNVALTSQAALDNSGTLYSAGTLGLVVSGNTTISGQIAAVGALNLQSNGALAVNGQLSSNTTITLTGLANLSTTATGLVFSGGALDVGTIGLTNAGVIASSNASTMIATTANLSNSGTISAATTLDLTTNTALTNTGKLLASGDMALNAALALTNAGVVEAGGDLSATAASLTNSQSMASLGGTLALSIAGDVTNSGALQASQALTLASNGTLANSGAMLSFGSMDLTTQTALNNAAAGVIMSSQALGLTTASLTNAGNIGTLNGALTLSNLVSFDNSGTVSAAGNLAIAPSGALLNTGTLLSGADLSLTATQDFTNQGTIQALNNVDVAGTNVTNAGTLQTINGTLTISASGDITNNAFLFGGFANRLLTDGNVINTATIGAGGLVEVAGLTGTHAASLTNAAAAKITSGFNVSLNADALVNHGEIAADNGIASLSATTALTHDGTLSAGAGISLAADAGFSLDGDVLSNGTLQITSAGAITNNANLQAEGNFALTAASLVNNDRIKSLNGGLDIASAGDVTNNATLFGGAALQIRTDGTLVLASDDLTSDGTMLLAGLTNDAMAAFTLANGQELVATGDAVIIADSITNTGAMASATGNLTVIGVNGLTNAQTGLLYAGNSLFALSDGVILNDGGVLLASQNMSIGGFQNPRATQFTNQNGGHVETFNGDISIRADLIENLREAVVTVTPAVTTNSGEYNLDYICASWFFGACTRGVIHKQTDYQQLNAESVQLFGTEAQIISGRDIYMQGDTITNAYSLISASRNVVFEATTINNVGRDSYDKTVTWNEKRTVSWNGGPRHYTPLLLSPSVTAYTNVTHYFGTIEAGGNIAGTISGTLTNGAVQEGLAPTVVSAPAPTLPSIAAGTTSAVPTGLAVAPTAASALTGGLMLGVTPDSSTLPGTGSTPATISAVDGSLIAGPSISALNQPALFVTNTDPNADFLIETRFDFIDLDSFLSSDYFIGQINFDPSITQKRLGDAYVETDYIRQQLFDQTGRRLLTPGVSEYDQMKAMYDGAINAAEALGLRPGIALTSAQIAALTEDIIWLEEQVVQGQRVLVPRVYLAAATLDANRESAKLVASAVSLEVGTFTNYGQVAANDIYINASADITNIGGSILADESLTLMAANTIRNTNGVISGNDVYLSARDIINETTATKIEFGTNAFDVANATALISATNDLTLIASNDITVTGADLVAGRTGYIQAGGNITFAALALNTETNFEWESQGGLFGIGAGSGSTHTESTTHQVSSVTAGAGLTIVSTGTAADGEHTADITFEGTQVSAGGDLQVAALRGNVILGAVQDTSYSDSQASSTGFLTSSTSRAQSFDLTNQVTALSGANIDVYAAGSLIVEGSTFNGVAVDPTALDGSAPLPTGSLSLTAANGDLVLAAVTDVHATSVQSSNKILFGLMGSSADVRSLKTTTTGITANVAGTTALTSGRDLILTAINITGDGKLTTDVAGDTYLLAAVDTAYTSSSTMGNNGIIITNTTQSDLTQSATFNSIQPDASFDPDSKITFGTSRNGVIDSAHPAAWLQNDEGTNRLAIAGAYLGWESTSSTTSATPSGAADTPPAWRTDKWKGDLIEASLPTATDGPGYGYIDDLLARDSTVNNTIELLDDHFYDQHKELNPAFKALVSIAVNAFIPGIGSGLLGSFATAAVNSFATELIAGALTGNFDLEQALGSALFAGVSSALGGAINLGSGASSTGLLGLPDGLLSPAALLDGIGDAFVSAALTTAVYGGDFGEAFKQNLKGFAIGQLTSALQFGVGELKGNNGIADGSFGAGLLHGLVGCAAAEASGGACASGFAVAFGTEMVAGSLGQGFAPDPSASAEDNEKARKAYEQNRAAMVGALAGYVTSGGNAVNVSQGSSIARGAVTWNRQLHRIEAQFLADLTKDLSEEEQWRYQAAACFLVKCAAGVPTDDPLYARLLAVQIAGEQYKAELAALQSATVAADKSYSLFGFGLWTEEVQVDLFEYTYTDFWGLGDDFDDGLSANREPLDRAAGGAAGVIGAGEAVGSAAGGAGLCAAGVASAVGTVAGCGAGAYLATTGIESGFNRSRAGFDELFGPYTSQAGAEVLASFDPNWTGGGSYGSALAGRFTGDLAGLALGAAGGAIARRVLNGGNSNPFAGVLGGKGGSQTIADAANDVVMIRRGTKGDWNQIANRPDPSTHYEFDNGYNYKTDDIGRVGTVDAELKYDPWDRNGYQQGVSGRDCRTETDCGGHLIASMFGGPGEGINIVPMDATLNGGGGAWGQLEREWRNALKADQSVRVRIEPQYTGTSLRPDSFEVTYSVDGIVQTPRTIPNTATGN